MKLVTYDGKVGRIDGEEIVPMPVRELPLAQLYELF